MRQSIAHAIAVTAATNPTVASVASQAPRCMTLTSETCHDLQIPAIWGGYGRRMVIANNDGGDADRSRLHYQGDAVDVEIEKVYRGGKPCWLWTVYHEARVVNSGVSRGPRRANWASWWAAWRYRNQL